MRRAARAMRVARLCGTAVLWCVVLTVTFAQLFKGDEGIPWRIQFDIDFGFELLVF